MLIINIICSVRNRNGIDHRKVSAGIRSDRADTGITGLIVKKIDSNWTAQLFAFSIKPLNEVIGIISGIIFSGSIGNHEVSSGIECRTGRNLVSHLVYWIIGLI